MEEKWVVAAKRADFNAIAAHFGIDPVIARIMRNRGMTTTEEMELYLSGRREDLCDPALLPDAVKAAEIISEKIRQRKRIRIIGDYDIDGVMSTYILLKALRKAGADPDSAIPNRIRDGYGLNDHLVTEAAQDGVDTILTCDNGIAAAPQVRLAKELGMTVIVTDHHEIPHAAEDPKREILPEADAVVNPKRSGSSYPFKELCGAAVAFKIVQLIYEQEGLPAGEEDEFLEYAGFATIGDVVDLTGENRILAKLGIERLRHTKNVGMRALILKKDLRMDAIGAYQIGFVLGPCLNASGRLETAQRSLQLLLCEDPARAAVLAEEIVNINEERKQMTADAEAEAERLVKAGGYDRDRVMVLFMPGCHESLAGLVAGRLREAYHRPVFVVTRGEEGCKGSARSIPEYSMYEEMVKVGDLFTRFGGHPMAAGFSLKEENVPVMRERLNELCTLTEDDLIPRVHIDVPMPIDYITPELVRQLEMLEPFGKGNEKPVFADRNLKITSLRQLGEGGRVIRMSLKSPGGRTMDAVLFGDVEELRLTLGQKYGILTAEDTIRGRCTHNAALNFTYYPRLDEYRGMVRTELRITGFKD